jgi:hypothetical protein
MNNAIKHPRWAVMLALAFVFGCAGCESASVFAPSNPLFQTWVFERYDSLTKTKTYIPNTDDTLLHQRGGISFTSQGLFRTYLPYPDNMCEGQWLWQSGKTYVIMLPATGLGLWPQQFYRDTLTIECTAATLTTRKFTK